MSRNVSLLSLATVVLTIWIALAVAGLFIADFGESEPEPVGFDETVSVGLTADEELRLDDDVGDLEVDLPQAQVFYSQYPYVVGYWGVEQFVNNHDREGHDQQFGHSMATYVTVYDDQSIELSEDSYPVVDGNLRWRSAEDVVYVVESDARTQSGETAIPFEQESNAESFVDSFGGDILSWEDVLDYPFDVDDAETVRERTSDQLAAADELVTENSDMLERPVSVVVGEDAESVTESEEFPGEWDAIDEVETAETVEAGLERADSETTVLITEGTYEEHVTVRDSVTLAGAGDAHLTGSGDGTVLEVLADNAAVTGLQIDGVGNETPGADATEGHDHGGHDHDHGEADEDAEWDEDIEEDYAEGDAGILVDSATGVLIQDTTVETPASGILMRDSPDAVVRNVTIDGNPNYIESHMGVVALRSPGVIEESTFKQGLDGVYTHHSNEVIIRNNTMVENRMGIHLMYTSDALLAHNEISDSITEGIYVMTGPQRVGVVGNKIQNTPTAIDLGGSEYYVAENKILGNDLGMQLDSVSTVVERNVIADNYFGIDTRSMLPTNRVTENDFIGNNYHVAGSTGPERIWTHNERGNYWEGAVGTTDGETLDKAYSPTDAVDSELHRVGGTPTLTQAPAMDALAGVEGAVSGMRDGEITDRAPLCNPVNADWLDQNGWSDRQPSCPGETE